MDKEIILALSLIKSKCENQFNCNCCNENNPDLWVACNNYFKESPGDWGIDIKEEK